MDDSCRVKHSYGPPGLLQMHRGERILQKTSVNPLHSDCCAGDVLYDRGGHSFLPGRGDKACFSPCPFSDQSIIQLLLTVYLPDSPFLHE